MAEQRFPLNHATRFEGQTGVREDGFGDQVLQGRGWRRDDHRGAMGLKLKQGPHPLRDEIDGRGPGFIRGLATVREKGQRFGRQVEEVKEKRHVPA